jgi:hypothetical protein
MPGDNSDAGKAVKIGHGVAQPNSVEKIGAKFIAERASPFSICRRLAIDLKTRDWNSTKGILRHQIPRSFLPKISVRAAESARDAVHSPFREP